MEKLNHYKKGIMDESAYSAAADAFLSGLFEQLEEQDAGGALDMDLADGILKIETENGKVFIVSKHAPSREIWLSSPLSGGLHFRPASNGNDWALPDGRRLSVILPEELFQATGVRFEVDIASR